MTVKNDESLFNGMQSEFIDQMAYGIRNVLLSKGISKEKLYDITDDLVFDICTLIDGSAECGEPEDPFVPYLTFNQPDSNPETLIASKEGSSLHDNSISIVKKVFDI